MADYTTTPTYAFKMPTDHVNTNTWGGYNNGNWSSADGLIGSIRAQLNTNQLTLTKTSSVEAAVLFNGVVGTSKLRWAIGIDTATETGSPANTGSNFHINRYDDNGNFIDQPLTLNRINASANFTGSVGINGALSTNSTISGNGIVDITGYVISKQLNPTTDSWFVLENSTGTPEGGLSWNHTSGVVQLYNNAGNNSLFLSSNGSASVSGVFSCGGAFTANGFIAGTGYLSRNGTGGSSDSGHQYNFHWNTTVVPLNTNDLWLDSSNWGQIQTTSDYRMKKDITPLGSMWDAVKALKPISYTYQDWTPPSSVEKQKEIGGPLIVGDDIERWGFLAHELQETLVMSAANGVKDDPVHVQSPNPFTVIAALTKALQEAMARIEALEAKG